MSAEVEPGPTTYRPMTLAGLASHLRDAVHAGTGGGVNPGPPLLDRNGIERALRLLGDRLSRRGVVGDVHVFGGAAMALAHDARLTSRDIDQLIRPHGVVLAEARQVARDLGLPDHWLNEQASVYVAPGGDPDAARVFDHPALRVSAASPRHLLAMKVLAARRRDAEDIRLLVDHLGLRSADEVLAVTRDVFADEEPPERTRLLLEEIVGMP